MSNPDDDSPEGCALRGFPRGVCRVIASRVHGDVAYVLLDTGPPGRRYLYGVNCERVDGHWTEGSSNNGSGWSLVGDVENIGTLKLWDDAPEGADRARATFDGESYETPVENGACLFVWWNVPCPDAWPQLESFRVAGVWKCAVLPF